MGIRNRMAAIERKANIKAFPKIDIFYINEGEILEEVMHREGRSMSDYNDPTVRDFIQVVYVSVKPQGQTA
jgi:hypothetical protein